MENLTPTAQALGPLHPNSTKGLTPSPNGWQQDRHGNSSDGSDDDKVGKWIEIIDETELDDDGRTNLLGGKRHRNEQPYDQSFGSNFYKKWLRPCWLGMGLLLILFSFWLLDSLKDPIFATLVDGNIDRHQPPAKLCSVVITLALVCLVEFITSARKQQRNTERSNAEVFKDSGQWHRMNVHSSQSVDDGQDDPLSATIFLYFGVAYCLIFLLVAYLLGFHEAFSSVAASQMQNSSSSSFLWHALAYFIFAMVESFGSLAVATFWSYTNSTLSLLEAEKYYGLIVALAQVGAIGGSTMVSSNKGYWSTQTLIVVACLVMLLIVVVMLSYDRRFSTKTFDESLTTAAISTGSAFAAPKSLEEGPSMLWSGVHLILKHNYVLLILGVSCLYEISLTCLDYQMKVLSWHRFEQEPDSDMTFAQFLGRFGQLTNFTSLLFSCFVFPYVIKHWGLRPTLSIFPTLLVVATSSVAVLSLLNDGQNLLVVLVVSMSLLKAMTYSLHDPSKELLYLPTSNAIKFRAKFWIDVVGERIAKAVGSSINFWGSSTSKSSLRATAIPSVLAAVGLWWVCWNVGQQFEKLVQTGRLVGVDDDDTSRIHYSQLHTVADDDAIGLPIVEEDEAEETLVPAANQTRMEMTKL